jgi:hypothetical protein
MNSPGAESASLSVQTRASLTRLAGVLSETADEVRRLASRAERLADACAAEPQLSKVMAAEERPLIVTRMTQLLDLLADTAAAVRRSEAQQLRSEGLTHEQIAAVFGVSRQRAAALLAPPPPPDARLAKRPPHHRRQPD